MILIGVKARVQQNRNDAGADRAPKQHREIDRIEHHQRHTVFPLDAQACEHRPDARGLVKQLCIGDVSRRVDAGSLVAAAFAHVPVHEICGGVIVSLGAHAKARF